MKASISLKADKSVKIQAQKVAKQIGLPLSGVVNVLLKQFILDRGLNVSTEPRLKPEVEALYIEMDKEIEQGKNLSPVFSSAKEMSAYLRKL